MPENGHLDLSKCPLLHKSLLLFTDCKGSDTPRELRMEDGIPPQDSYVIAKPEVSTCGERTRVKIIAYSIHNLNLRARNHKTSEQL